MTGSAAAAGEVLLTGATGVIGRELVPALTHAGWSVRALVRGDAQAEQVRRQGARPVSGDLLDAESVRRAGDGIDAVLHFATAIPRDRQAPGAWEANDRLRIQGTQNLIGAARAGHARRVVAQSVVMLYGDHDDAWIDEDTPIDPSPPAHLRSAAMLERAVLDAEDLAPIVLRGGLLLGSGTGTGEQLLDTARTGRLALDGDGEHFLSLVHPADLAQAVLLALDHAPSRTILNVVDDEPVRQRELYAAAAQLTGGPRPSSRPSEVPPPSLRCSNRRLRALGFQPRYPTYHANLRTIEAGPPASGPASRPATRSPPR